MPISPVLVKLKQKPQVQAQLIKFQTNQSCMERPYLKKIYLYAINHLKTTLPLLKYQMIIPVARNQSSALSEQHAHFLDYSQKNHVALYIFQSVVMNVHSVK